MKKTVTMLLVIALMATGMCGCATTGSDRQRTETEGAVVGAAAGAIIGGLLGYAIGGRKGAAWGAGIGAAAGGVGGYAYGSHVADQKEKYASQEDWLDACIENADQVCEETRQYSEGLSIEIETIDQETMMLAEQYDQKFIERETLVAKKNDIEGKLALARENLEKAQFELENQEKVFMEAYNSNQASYMHALGKKIEELRQYITELESHTEMLASFSQRMAV